jgi:hypothetical protein
MLFALICDDKPDALALRQATREAHLAFLRDAGGVALAGPLLDDGGRPNGSLIVIEAADRAAAEAWAAADPYARAGLFAAVAIRPWTRAIG